MTIIKTAVIGFFAFLATMNAVYATDYVSVNENVAILFDEPSLKAKKIFVVNRYMPLEQVVTIDKWAKVRESTGNLGWIEKRFLSKRHFVIVTPPLVTLHEAPDEKSTAVVQVKKQIALEWLENTDTGWIKVRHLDGAIGYIKATEVWGD